MRLANWIAGLLLTLILLVAGSPILLASREAESTTRNSGGELAWPSNVTIQLGPIEVIRGPDGSTDNPFHTLTTDSALLGYIANNESLGYIGGSLETLRQLGEPVLERGDKSSFDSCGAWLNSTWKDGSVIRGWYHGETNCNYELLVTDKSVAYAESHDGGHTFDKPLYPGNQVLTAAQSCVTKGHNDVGDHRVIQRGDYLYMYFLTDCDWRIHVARSHVSDGGRPGTWNKYYEDNFSEPGIGGESSRIDSEETPTDPFLTFSWLSSSRYLDAYLGFSFMSRDYSTQEFNFAGFGFTASRDGLHDWADSPYVVLQTGREWQRDETSAELAWYPSLVSLYGNDAEIGDVFWLYYMYIKPGDGFDNRYLVRRKVRLSSATSTNPVDLVPRIALTQYQQGDDTWFTTTNVDRDYEQGQTIGYLFTDQVPNSIPVNDCYIDFWHDHMLSPDSESCEGGHFIRRAGWISTVPFPGSVRVYRCFETSTTNHFISTDSNCNGAQLDWPFGYIATEPSLPQNAFVALSSYYQADQQDSWATTNLPPQNYTFERRLGYLFTAGGPPHVPVYDCYIPDWNDHMLAPTIEECQRVGVELLGQRGWISSTPFDGATALYRCNDNTTHNHFVSLDPTCNGHELEWRYGYLVVEPELDAVWRTLYLPLTTNK